MGHPHLLVVLELRRSRPKRDQLASYICDSIETTLRRYGRTVKRVADHTLIVSVDYLCKWRVVVRRTGHIDFEPVGDYAQRHPIPNLVGHIADALAGEYEFTATEVGCCVAMEPRALSKAPVPLPTSTRVR